MGTITDQIIRITPRVRLKTLVVNICDHCNLNCVSCDHFSPIAEKKFYDSDKIIRDMKQIHSIIDNDVDRVSVMGGEPLLHPDVCNIIKNARLIFKKTEIWLSTNGVLLNEMPEDFWFFLHDEDVTLNVTKYPIGIDYEKIEENARSYGVSLQFYNDKGKEKTMGHYPLDIKGSQDSSESFIHCFHANNRCNMLHEGRLYTCTIAPCIPIFNKKFGTEIPLTERDGIDIYQVFDRRELFRRLAEPMPICRFCDVRNRTFGHEWKQSSCDINEWT